MQIVNVFLCRGERASVLATHLTGNRLIVFGIAVEIALILFIYYTPIGNRLFGTAPIALEVWLVCRAVCHRTVAARGSAQMASSPCGGYGQRQDRAASSPMTSCSLCGMFPVKKREIRFYLDYMALRFWHVGCLYR